MPSAALRPKNPCRASLIEGWSVGVPGRPHPTTPASGGGTLLTLAASGGGPVLALPHLRGRVGREQADGPPALRPESTCHMHYFRRACGRWSKRHCGVPANPRTLGESDTSNGGIMSGPRGPLMIQGPPPPSSPSQARGVGTGLPPPRMNPWTGPPRHHIACVP